jgi:proteasome lid subunit RPN8/RPN11
MSTTDAYNPVTQPSMMYPQFGNLKPTKRFYVCPTCRGNANTHLKVQIQKSEEMIFGFQCNICGKSWFISSKLILNSIFEEELARMARYTKSTGKEFGGLIIKTPKGIRIDMVEVGEDLSVSFKQTHPLNEGEEVVGTIHNHPISDIPSDWDIGTFLNNQWECVSIVNGANGTVNVMVKTKKTVIVTDVMKWAIDNAEVDFKTKGDTYGFMIYRGKINNLQLINNVGRDVMPITSIERLLMNI